MSDEEEHQLHSSIEIGIGHLPPELLIHLFSYLDGISLIRMSCVCRKFRDMAKVVWQPVFKRELQESVLDVSPGVYKALHRPHRFYCPDVPWKKLYTSVMIWQTLKKWDVAVSMSNVFDDEVSCFGVAGSDILFGTIGGFVLKVSKYDLLDEVVFCQHKTKINGLVVQISSDNDYEDEKLCYRIISLSRDRCLQVNDIDDFGHSFTNISKFENIVGYQDNLFEWSEMSSYVFDVRVDIREETLSRVCLEIHLPSPSVHGRVMAIDPNQNLLITHKSGPMKWDGTSGSWTTITNFKSVRVLRGYIFPYGISVSITTDYSTILTVESDSILIEWPVLMRPTSALLYGHVFIVGTASGHLIFFSLKSRKDILKISPFKFDAKFYSNQSSSILYLGVSEGDDDHPFPDILAATRHQVICVRTIGMNR